MGWGDILKRKGISDSAKEVVEEVMNTSSEKLTVGEIREKIIQLAERSQTTLSKVPTTSELGYYLSKNYSFDVESRKHPITGDMRKMKVYFKEE